MQFQTKNQAITAGIEKYEQMTRSLIFLIVETRLNIIFATALIARFSKNSFHKHTKAVKTIFKYLKSSRKQGIIYGKTSKEAVKI